MSLFGLNTGYSLKDLLENPILQNPTQLKRDGEFKPKEKGSMSPGFDPTSAFLGPNLWNTSQYTTEGDISLEYMDLDEFLSENGIPVDISENSNDTNGSDNIMSLQGLKTDSDSKQASSVTDKICTPTPYSPQSDKSPEEKEIREEIVCGSPATVNVDFKVSEEEVTLATVPVTQNPGWNSPALNVEFEIGDGEQPLVNVPGEEMFDPKIRKFSENELKPQPMIKKSRKVFVPDEQKDDRYWSRRKKNNVAAKRSRDARRVKENQIAMRACFLEKCNQTLTVEVQKLKKENEELKKSLEACEKKLKNV